MERQMLTVPEAAEILRVSTTHVYKLAERGELEHRRLGRRVLIPRVVVDGLCGLASAPAAVTLPPPATDRVAAASGAAGPRDTDGGSLGKCAAVTVGRSGGNRPAAPISL